MAGTKIWDPRSLDVGVRTKEAAIVIAVNCRCAGVCFACARLTRMRVRAHVCTCGHDRYHKEVEEAEKEAARRLANRVARAKDPEFDGAARCGCV